MFIFHFGASNFRIWSLTYQSLSLNIEKITTNLRFTAYKQHIRDRSLNEVRAKIDIDDLRTGRVHADELSLFRIQNSYKDM